MQIIVTGCVAQAEGEEILKRNKSVDYIFGPQSFHKTSKRSSKIQIVIKFTMIFYVRINFLH